MGPFDELPLISAIVLQYPIDIKFPNHDRSTVTLTSGSMSKDPAYYILFVELALKGWFFSWIREQLTVRWASLFQNDEEGHDSRIWSGKVERIDSDYRRSWQHYWGSGRQGKCSLYPWEVLRRRLPWRLHSMWFFPKVQWGQFQRWTQIP